MTHEREKGLCMPAAVPLEILWQIYMSQMPDNPDMEYCFGSLGVLFTQINRGEK